MNEKICLYTPPLCDIKSYLDVVDIAVRFGIKNIETINAYELSVPNAEFAKRLREYADEKGVKFVCVSVGVDLVEDDNEKNIEMVKAYADIAVILGSPYLHHTVALNFSDPEKTNQNRELYFNRGVSAVEEIYDYCKKIGITAVYEDQGYLFNGKLGFEKLINATDRKFGVVADFGNIMFVDEDINEFIPAFADRIVNVHVKDYILTDGKSRNIQSGEYPTFCGNYLRDCMLGEGEVNFEKSICQLKEIGYNGYFALECPPMGEDKELSFAKNLDFLMGLL